MIVSFVSILVIYCARFWRSVFDKRLGNKFVYRCRMAMRLKGNIQVAVGMQIPIKNALWHSSNNAIYSRLNVRQSAQSSVRGNEEVGVFCLRPKLFHELNETVC